MTQPKIIDPLDFDQVNQQVDQARSTSHSGLAQHNSLYVDPLELSTSDQQADQDVAKKLQDSHDKLMAKTGGQAVEEDLGGWLLVITIGLIIFVLIAVGSMVTNLLFALRPHGHDITPVVLATVDLVLALYVGKIVYRIFRRQNPLKELSLIAVIIIAMAISNLLVDYGDFVLIAVRSHLATGVTGLGGVVHTLYSLTKLVASVILAIGPLAYFTNSRRVRRTLIKSEM